jgi:hypothetical protein
VTLGLTSQIDLDLEVQKAAKEKPVPIEQGATLLPASVTTAPKEEPEPVAPGEKPTDDLNVDAVFAKLKQIGGKGE